MKKSLFFILTLLILVSSLCIAAGVADEPETIEVPFMLTMNPAMEKDLVQQAINDELDKAGVGVHVVLVGIDFASWPTQMNLMLTDGSIDLFNCTFMPSIAVLADQGSIAPMEDLLNEYGQGILETLGDYIECARIGDHIYGTPKIDAFSRTLLFFMNKKMADDAGIDPESITDLESLTEALKTVKAVYPDLAMISSSAGGAYVDLVGIDYLGTDKPLGVLMLDPETGDTTVVNYYESDMFKDLLAWGKKWNELGFFLKDPLNAQDGSQAYVSNGQSFGTFGAYSSEEVGRSIQEKSNGIDLYVAQVQPWSWATTSNVLSMTWCVPELSKHKEAAVKFLNELYTNPAIANLICNGIEGKHYVKTDAGNITFAEGLDAFTTGWPSGMGTFWPNITISLPWAPDAADVYEGWLQSNQECKMSPALGFSFDATNVADEISACAGVVDQYQNSLLLGIGDTDTLYAEFLSALERAGINEIIEDKQAQIDAWKAK